MKKSIRTAAALLACGTMMVSAATAAFAAPDADASEHVGYMAFTSPYVEVIDGTITWNENDHTWKVEYPSEYGTCNVSGTYEDDGTMVGLEDNMGGFAIGDVPLMQERFSEYLEGRFNAPLAFSNEFVNVKGGVIYWDENSGEWRAEYPSEFGTCEVSGTFDDEGILTGLEDNMNGFAIGDVPIFQEIFDNARKGVFVSAAVDEASAANALSDSVEAFEDETNNKWKSVIVDIAKKYDPEVRNHDIIFYGASNFARWDTMEEDLMPFDVQNHAFGGSTDKDLELWAQFMLYPYAPRYVFFQTGSNDYVESTAPTDEEKVAEAMTFKKAMFAEFHEALPECKFIVMSGILLPGRTEFVDMTLEINDQLKAFCDETDYMIFVDAEALTYDRAAGAFVNDVESLFVEDQIHLTGDARITWAQNFILPVMAELNMPVRE